jgi:hypothetical protein
MRYAVAFDRSVRRCQRLRGQFSAIDAGRRGRRAADEPVLPIGIE